MQTNEYLNQVVQEQARVEGELRGRRRAGPKQAPDPAPQAAAPGAVLFDAGSDYDLGEAPAPAGNAVDYRVTGWWRWKTVVVPPNAYVVHTRRGHPEPLHLGLGVSFRYNP